MRGQGACTGSVGGGGAGRDGKPTDEDTKAMVELVGQLGQELAKVLQGVKTADLRNRVHRG